jgi:peroxiredoxin
MRQATARALVVLFTFASLALSACAQPAQPKPEELLRQMADYIGGLPAFSTRINLDMRLQAQGVNNNTTTKIALRLERPNRVALAMEGVVGMTIVSDGKTLTQFVPMVNRYTQREAPADFAALADADGGAVMMGLPAYIIPASGEALYKSLMEGVIKSEYVGNEKVGDIETHRCRFIQENFSWDIWIGAGREPLVHKVVPDFSKQLAAAGEAMKDAKLEYLATFADWNVAPKFTDADFTFTPPAGAEKVESLFEGLAGGQAEGPHPLVGQPAPPFKTVNLKEEPIDLASHAGKDIVMLDFWATWCGPCVQAMPEVVGVAKKFADRGVVFYAVNVAEDAETIGEFLKANELEVPVAMDPEGTITQQYKAEGIPQTVLIGKDGKVQVVHVGFSPNLADELSSQIEELLAGKDLAAATLAEAETANEAKPAEAEQAAEQE